ncbi:MAG: hypothetical protein M1436_08980, partial [Acidobacteria bacterium]|nr:hypothetical protein [Acidobacteriota bacterium]
LENIRRNALLGRPGFRDVTNDDLRFKTWTQELRHESKAVRLRGRVSTERLRFPQYTLIAIQDGAHGFVLQGDTSAFPALAPGDDIEAAGNIATLAGQVVLLVTRVKVLGHGAAPEPRDLTLKELQSFRHLGELASAEGRVLETGQTTAGAYILIGSDKNAYKIFLPFPPHGSHPVFFEFRPGDKLRAVGIACQYAPIPPYDRWFELAVARASDVVQVGRRAIIPPDQLAILLVAALFFGVVWWSRERRLRAQRKLLRSAYELGEEIIGAASSGEILKRVSAVVPRLFNVTHAHLFLPNRMTRTLDAIQSAPGHERLSIPLDSPAAGV